MAEDFKNCPLLSFLEENPAELDMDYLKEFHEAAQGGDPELVYSYGLMLHQMMFDNNFASVMPVIPEDVRDRTLAQSFNAFAASAQAGYADGLLMTGWCKLMGFGTDEDPAEARIWFDAAAKVIPEDHPQIIMMRRELERAGIARPALN